MAACASEDTATGHPSRLQVRNQILEYSRSLQTSVFESYRSLNAFLLDPNRKEYQAYVERTGVFFPKIRL